MNILAVIRNIYKMPTLDANASHCDVYEAPVNLKT